MPVRMTAVAGQFYESSPEKCLQQIKEMLPQNPNQLQLPNKIFAGIVPHAGYMFSGKLAALVFATIKHTQPVDTFVIFGAVHTAMARVGLLYDAGQWGTPLGTIDIDEQLADEILQKNSPFIQSDCDTHSREHSIEVQIPIIQHLFPDTRIVPIMVPPILNAHEVGSIVAETIKQSEKNVLCIASTDLTHYGPSYGFTTMGTGPQALKWAKEQNDKFFIDLTLSMQADKLVESAQMYSSACGSGATAAAVQAAKTLGATKGLLLDHTTSADVVAEKFNQQSTDSVGYAAIVFT